MSKHTEAPPCIHDDIDAVKEELGQERGKHQKFTDDILRYLDEEIHKVSCRKPFGSFDSLERATLKDVRKKVSELIKE